MEMLIEKKGENDFLVLASMFQEKEEAIKCLDLCNKVNPNYLEAYEKKGIYHKLF